MIFNPSLPKRVLIFDDECPDCSALAQLLRHRDPDLQLLSIYSLPAQVGLREILPEGWVVRPYLIETGEGQLRIQMGWRLWLAVIGRLGLAGNLKAARALLNKLKRQRQQKAWMLQAERKLRVHRAASREEAERLSGQLLRYPDRQDFPLPPDKIVIFYHLPGVFKIASYWENPDYPPLTLEQSCKELPPPTPTGQLHSEPLNGPEGQSGQLYRVNDSSEQCLAWIPLTANTWLTVASRQLTPEQMRAIIQRWQ